LPFQLNQGGRGSSNVIKKHLEKYFSEKEGANGIKLVDVFAEFIYCVFFAYFNNHTLPSSK